MKRNIYILLTCFLFTLFLSENVKAAFQSVVIDSIPNDTASSKETVAIDSTVASNTASSKETVAIDSTVASNTASSKETVAIDSTVASNTASSKETVAIDSTVASNTASSKETVPIDSTVASNTSSIKGPVASDSAFASDTSSIKEPVASDSAFASDTSSIKEPVASDSAFASDTSSIKEPVASDSAFASDTSSIPKPVASDSAFARDTSSVKEATVKIVYPVDITIDSTNSLYDSVRPQDLKVLPFVTLQQFLKGKIAGVQADENTGEPGTLQKLLIRGASAPFYSLKDVQNIQPAIFLNGIPFIQDHPFVYDIQQYDLNPIGPATNLLSFLDPSDIKTIRLVKNADELAKLGPIASNGAIWIETKPAVPGNMKMEFNGYYGMAQQGNVMPVNAAYIRDFRQPFYDKYATPSDYLNYPAFLGDSSNLDYYGSSNWPDIYYKVTPVYHGNFSLTTGSKRANFRFFGGLTTDAGAADNTSLKKYNTNVDVNIIPFDWLKFNASVGGEHLDRARNRNIRDRMAEMRYIPELNTPIAPNKNAYGDFISLYDQVMDDNLSTLIHGFITMNIDLKKLTYTSKVAFDYNENIRDLFWPSDLMNQINYVSNYFGYNQRAYISNEINYDLKKSNYSLQLTGGAINQYDVHRYNYGMGYDGTSDFIKVNSGGYLAYRFTDEERLRLFSFYGNAKFKYKNDFELDALLRSDGSSLMLPNKRWLITPSFRLGFNLKNIFWEDSKNINDLRVSASWAKIGKLLSSDIFSAGPQYVSDIGWQGANILSAYNGMAGLSRPYADGWVGYGVDWPYTNQLDLSINGSFFKNKLDVSLSLYNKDDKNQLWQIPIPQEYGYDNTYMNGLSVNNKGVELTIGSDIIKQDHQRFQWHTDLNVSLNKNKLTQLPNGLDELAMDNHLLKVGKSIDGFWLFKNEGIYTSDDEVPRDPKTGKLLSYDGVDFKAGDPKWKDLNGDYIIDDNDKELLGHSMPQVMGGWQNTFSYKHFDLSFDLIWALGLNAINSRQSSMYDFINQGASNSLNSVWEIYTWQKENGDHLNKYPLYNPWSLVDAYQPDQDLFLENASFLKLRSATLGYDFGRIKNKKGKRTVFDDIYVYTTVTNLFTITKFSGKDPELTDINGNYTGYNIPLPRLFVFGFRVGL